MAKSLDGEVRRRANFACEYCRLPQAASRLKFVLDHIVARQHQGPSTSRNLALCCGHCNLNKGPNLSDIDPDRRRMARLFNPRRDVWNDHFAWDGAVIVGKTPVGRATIGVLKFKAPQCVAERQ